MEDLEELNIDPNRPKWTIRVRKNLLGELKLRL